MKRKIIYIILSLVLPIFVSAQTISEATNLPISGSARAWLGLGNEQYNFPAAMAEVGIKANFGNKSYYSNLDFRFRSGYQFNQFNTTLDLKEAFVGFRTNSFDFSLGKKILDWSRVDYNSVVNPVMANDFFFISTESDDMKMAQLMLHISLEVVDRMKWQTVVIPVFTPSIYRFELFDLSDMGGFTNLPGIGGNSNSDNGGGFNIPGLDNIPDFSDWFDWGNIPGLGDLSGLSDLFGSNNLPTMNDAMPEIHFLEGKRPEQNFLNASIASRLTGDFNFASFGLTGFHGYSTGYGFTLNSITYLALPWQINMIPVYYKQSLLGFDAEIPIRNSIFKFEAAYNYIHDSVSEIPTELSLLFLADSKLTQMLEQMPYPSNGYHANIAIERMYRGYVGILQYSAHYTPNFKALPEPSNALQESTYEPFIMMANFNRMIFNQKDKYTHELSVMLSKNFLYDALHTEMAVAYKFNTKEFMFRPGVSYAINDNLSVGLGAFFLYGPEETLNSYASKVLNSLFFQIKANF